MALWFQTPDHTGFGSKVVKQVLAIQLGGVVELTYDPLGVTCRVIAPANSVLSRPEPHTRETSS